VDNVIAIAGAAQNSGEHQFLLIVLGLLISSRSSSGARSWSSS
jgi:predicted tellurium resistance membrane protein TerC